MQGVSIKHILIMGFLSALFGCGDSKPGLFSSNGYHINSDKVWYKTSLGMSYNVSEVVGADPKTFQERELRSKIYAQLTAFYGFDQKSVFWAGVKIEGADLATFEYVGSQYSKDKHAVYYMAQRLTDDVAHFTAITPDFIRDAQNVYWGGSVFSEDPDHFVEVGQAGSGYFKDSKKCWYGIYELTNADAKTLRYIGPATAADASHLYHEMNEIEGVDIKTYQILEQGYARDAHSVYAESNRIEGADPVSFHVLGNNYSLDAKHCYYRTMPLPDADPATFQVIDPFYTKDARHVFTNGAPIEGADPATFRVLNGPAGCSCDAHYAYSMSERIPGADPSKFPATGECKSCNESGVTF